MTPLVQGQIDALANEKNLTQSQARAALLLEKQPTMRFVEVEQLAALVVFLCTDAAASITGTAMPIDGGWTAR